MNVKLEIVGLALISMLASGCQKNINPKINSLESTQTGQLNNETRVLVKDILSANSTQETSEVIQSKNIAKIRISDIKGTPLDMGGIYNKNDLQQFFGINQYEIIFEKYNKEITRKDKDGDIVTDKNEYSNLELSFPRVYDSLVSLFPDSIKGFILKYPEFKKDIGNSVTVLIVNKLENGKFALGYYKEGNLFLATHVSPGKISGAKNKTKKDKVTGKTYEVVIPGGDNTPEGVFNINKSEGFKFKRSSKFELSPMPYAIQIVGGVFLHHGQDVDGKKRSHGCIRVPGFYEKELYENVISGTKIVIRGTKR